MNKSQDFDLICIDFDETLFNHALLNQWVDEYLSGLGYHRRGAYLAGVDGYHERLSDVLRLYKHEEHFKDVSKKGWSFIAGELKKQLRKKPCQFCYGDSHAFIKWALERSNDVRILSFGHGEYQRFKMGLCGVLTEYDLPIHIVDTPKSQFLERYFNDVRNGMLVDDKYPLDLPSNFEHVLIDRSGKYAQSYSLSPHVRYTRTLSGYIMDN